jgi:hypothetical protein
MEPLIYCVWCGEAVDGGPTMVKGNPFHWRCLMKRKAALDAEQPATGTSARATQLRLVRRRQ